MKTKTIRYNSTLDYCDGIQVFDARDPIGGHYVALLVEQPKDVYGRYLVVGVAPKELQAFRLGKTDLRSLIGGTNAQDWYLANVDGDIHDQIVLEPRQGAIPEAYLPEPGFVLGSWQSSSPSDVATEARARNNVVVELTLETPESADGHRIRADVLSGLLLHMQVLVRHAYTKAMGALSLAQRRKIDRETAPMLDVAVPAMAGSFRLVLEAAQVPNLFGTGEIIRALDALDDVMQVASDPEKTVERVLKYRGHMASAYVRLLRFMVESDVSMQYAWASPDRPNVSRRSVSRAQAEPLVAVLSASASLGVEPVTLTGILRKVDVDAGTWRLKSAEDNEEYSGKVRPGVSLSRLLTDGNYRFVCEEEAEEVTGTGREVRTLYLTVYSEVRSKG